jgi:hypothetical protein
MKWKVEFGSSSLESNPSQELSGIKMMGGYMGDGIA